MQQRICAFSILFGVSMMAMAERPVMLHVEVSLPRELLRDYLLELHLPKNAVGIKDCEQIRPDAYKSGKEQWDGSSMHKGIARLAYVCQQGTPSTFRAFGEAALEIEAKRSWSDKDKEYIPISTSITTASCRYRVCRPTGRLMRTTDERSCVPC